MVSLVKKYDSSLPNYYIRENLSEPAKPKATRVDLSPNSNKTIRNWQAHHADGNGHILKSLKHLIEKVQYIDYPKFITGLNQSILSAAEHIDFGNRHTAVGIVPGKSNEWVTALAFKCNKTLSQFPCFNIAHNGRGTLLQSMEASVHHKLFNHLPSQFILIDDGSYSGQQLVNHVQSIIDIIQYKAKPNTKIILIVPYMTERALARLLSLQIPNNIALVIADHLPIPTVKQVMSEEDYINLKAIFPEHLSDDDSGVTLTCFQHKVPNSQSFLAPIANLMTDIQTPYKKKEDGKFDDE